MIAGGMLMQGGVRREAGAAPASARLLDQVMARVRMDFIDTLSADELNRRTASGFVKELEDPGTALLSPERLRRLRGNTAGRWSDIGAELDVRDGLLTVIAAVVGSPADSAGIRSGDRIVSIDGKAMHALTTEEAQEALRGASGSRVKLAIERGESRLILTITRRALESRPVRRAQLIDRSVGYVVLAAVGERAAGEVRRAVDSLRVIGASSLILDLRRNPGGLLEQGIAVADLFLDPQQKIASTAGRTAGADRTFRDAAPQPWPKLPVVVLVDSGTASAAEVVAAALQDNRRAVLVGTATYGKGSAQSIFPVVGGGGLKLTTARWFTPNGLAIARDSTAGGITPDVVVPRDSTASADPVLARALQLLDGARSVEALRERGRRR